MEFTSMEVIYQTIMVEKGYQTAIGDNSYQVFKNIETNSIDNIYLLYCINPREGLLRAYPNAFSLGTIVKTKERCLHCRNGPAIINGIFKGIPGNKNRWWFDGIMVSPEFIFDQLSPEEQEQALWKINEWK